MSGMEKWKHIYIPFADIKKATKDFKKETGKGGYGSVYEGHLLINGKNTKVAVKRLNEKGQQGLKEFLNEIDLLSGQQHENIITLVGYCDDGNEKIIVYEFAERGSLDFYFGFKDANYSLTWLQRLKIVVDVARGLDHLHNHLQKKQVIIHRDIKTSNILLDDKWVAKISDFGLSKTTVTGFDRSTVVTYACGTPGYVEPELKHYFTANPKSDVYSFGMLLFEVLCGRLCNLKYEEDEILSAEVAEKYYTKSNLKDIIDPRLRDQLNPNALSKFSAIAYKCLLRREQRPLMDVVKKELEETLKIQGFDFRTRSMSGEEKWMALRIRLSDILLATNNFDECYCIGSERFGVLYIGELSVRGLYAKFVIKRSLREFGLGTKDFLAEIQLLSGQPHENIITLVGYCDEGNEKIIVYEYAEHGGLDRYIPCNNTTDYALTWLQRLKIAVDVARGLDHLQNELQKKQVTVHKEIKSSNILLDHNWAAKLFDLGVSGSSFSGYVKTTIFTKPFGEIGYDAPEYMETGIVTEKSDVYSFGVVLFEVLCGRLTYDTDENGTMLPQLAKEYYDNNKLDMIIDPSLREQMSLDSMKEFSAIAYNCLQDPEQRPLMNVVKKELEEILRLEVLRWRNFISKHRYILDIENFSSKNDIEN